MPPLGCFFACLRLANAQGGHDSLDDALKIMAESRNTIHFRRVLECVGILPRPRATFAEEEDRRDKWGKTKISEGKNAKGGVSLNNNGKEKEWCY